MKRQLPPPFQRKSVNLGGGVVRAWQNLLWKDVEVGDVVADKGLVEKVTPLSATTKIIFKSGSAIVASNDAPVFVFSRKRDA